MWEVLVNYHYAVEHVVDSDLPADTVTKINQIGYTINGKVIKPASVVVAN